MTYDTRGRHIMADVSIANSTLTIADLLRAAEYASMSVLETVTTDGTLALLLAESHLTVHRRGTCIHAAHPAIRC